MGGPQRSFQCGSKPYSEMMTVFSGHVLWITSRAGPRPCLGPAHVPKYWFISTKSDSLVASNQGRALNRLEANPTGRVGSTDFTYATISFTNSTPALVSDSISLPTLHAHTDGWLKSSRIISRSCCFSSSRICWLSICSWVNCQAGTSGMRRMPFRSA